MKRSQLFGLFGVVATLLFGGLTAQAQADFGCLMNPDARSMSLGGLTTTTLSSSNTLFNNASLVSFLPGTFHLGGSYYASDGNHNYSVAGYFRFGGNAIQAGWREYTCGEKREQALELAYSRRIARIFSVGVTGRYMNFRSATGSTSKALAANLSASCQIPMSALSQGSSLLIGARLNNLGGFISGEGTLPLNLAAGSALDYYINENHRMLFGVDVAYYFKPDYYEGLQVAVGAEYEFMQLLQLRAGYHYAPKESAFPSYGSIGAGIHLFHIRVDAAYLIAKKGSPLHNTYTLNFGFDF